MLNAVLPLLMAASTSPQGAPDAQVAVDAKAAPETESDAQEAPDTGASSKPSTTIGIFSISVVGLDESVEQTAIDALSQAIGEVEGLKAISRTELEAMLSAEKMKDVLGCDDVSCLSEIGMAAGAEHVVAGSVSRVDESLVVNLQLVNVNYATVENRVTLKWDGAPGEIADVLGAAAEQLVILAKERKPGTLRIVGVPEDAGITVDGEVRGVGPMVVDGLPVGVHTLLVEASGFETFQRPFIVRHGKTSQIEISMNEKPFYSKWWFWTTVGAGLVGGTVATVVAVTGGQDGRNGPTGLEITYSPPGG